jgi:Na+/melibiose symporter-like transporter
LSGIFIHRLHLNDTEKRTFRLHFIYSCLEGILAGVLILNEFVFIKSLKGSTYQLGLLFQFSVLVFLLLIFINEFLKRIRNRRRFLRLVGILTRTPLILLLVFPRDISAVTGTSIYHYLFLGIFLAYYLAWPVIYPVINSLLKNAYEHTHFGTLYGYSTAANRILMLVTTFLYGLLLDRDSFAFTYVFPAVAVLGIISVYLLSMIENRDQTTINLQPGKGGSPSDTGRGVIFSGFWHSVRESALNQFRIVKKNAPYRHFEISFMLYGFAFMISNTIIIIFFERVLHLNYSSVAFYKNAFNLLAIILLPFFGRLLGSMDPRKFGVYTFLSMLLSILFMVLSEYFPFYFDFHGIRIFYMLIMYVVFMGIFTATISLLWYIGSAYFCSKEEAGDYQSVHLILTGVRGAIAPTGGVILYELTGFTWAFILSMLFLVAAVGVMIWSYKKDA